MAGGFGILSSLEFLQNWVSAIIAGAPPAVIHNVAKYHALKKALYLSALEGVEGDYLEFGIFQGSSFCHAIRCCHSLVRVDPSIGRTRFFGFDSFSGFGELADGDKHPFYHDKNFSTSSAKVERRVRRVARGSAFKLVAGFFAESLKPGPGHYGIERSRVLFIDSDTHGSAQAAFAFCLPTIQQGTLIILDDYFSYRGSEELGVAGAFAEFIASAGIRVRQVYTYGMGGAVYVVSSSAR